MQEKRGERGLRVLVKRGRIERKRKEAKGESERGIERERKGAKGEAKGDTFQKLPRGASHLLEAFGRCPL